MNPADHWPYTGAASTIPNSTTAPAFIVFIVHPPS